MLENKYTRRGCLKVIGLLTIAGTATFLRIEPVFGHNISKLKKVSRTLPMMNTYVTITIYDESEDKAIDAQSKAFFRMKQLIDRFTRFDPNSYVGFLNENKQLNDVPPELYDLLLKAKSISKLSSNKFDITILPLLELIENEVKIHGHFPEIKDIEEVLPWVGWQNISISPKKITMAKGTKITLDGIAKGYIVDKGAELLIKCGIKHAVIDAGGDIRTIGDKDGHRSWRIGIEDPYREKGFIQIIGLSNLAIATSGNYRNYFNSSKKLFHIIDKEMALSPQRTVSCSVIAKSACIADGLATGLFCLSPEKSVQIANKLNVPLFTLTHGKRFFKSSSWEKFIT